MKVEKLSLRILIEARRVVDNADVKEECANLD